MKNKFTRRNFCKTTSATLIATAAARMHGQLLDPYGTGGRFAIGPHKQQGEVDSRGEGEVTRERQEVLDVRGIPLASLGNQKLAGMGFVDVTQAPFHADATGKTDSTASIQRAIFFSRENQMVLFFPEGVYQVSDTLRCPHGTYDPVSGAWRGRDLPCVLMGTRLGKTRPKIVLSPNSPGYGDPSSHKCVVEFWCWEKPKKSKYERQFKPFAQSGPPLHQDDSNMYQMLIGIDIAIGEGNPGAVGVRCRGAQGTGVQDCTIDATHGFSGLNGGSGSGGGHYNVTVLGGQIGADLSQSQPAPTIAGFTLIGQTRHAILYDGRQTLTAVGCRIEFPGSGPAIVVGAEHPTMQNGQVSLVDSTIAFTTAGSNVAFGGTSSLYLNNVFIKGAERLADWGNGQPVELKGDGWTCVREYAHGRAPLSVSNQGIGPFTFTSPIYVDGKRLDQDLLEMAQVDPPADLTAKHIWGEDFPSWERNAVSVKDAPYNAAGDGKKDDFAALQRAINEHEIVFLPKGKYLVSQTLQLKPNTKLLGLHLDFSWITAASGKVFRDAAKPQPVVATADDRNATTVLAFVGISTGQSVSGAYALDWRAGRNSMYRSANIQFPRGRDVRLNEPLVLVTGNGGGRWYNFFQESWQGQGSDYRHLLVSGTSEPLHFYQCNPEHSRSAANMEIRGAKDVSLYGLKSEGNQPILLVRDSNQIRMFGYGGNASARPGTTLFKFVNTPDFLAANLITNMRFAGGAEDFFGGIGVNPLLWSMLSEQAPDGSVFVTKPLERPVLVRRRSVASGG